MSQRFQLGIFRSSRAICVLLVFWSCFLQAEDRSWRFENVSRVVAFADVHGDFERLFDLLMDTEIIDEAGNWIGGSTHLVSTGDLVDRGPRSREVLDLLMKLQEQAPESGGQVIVTLGNHEVMNIQNDLRYVSREEYAAFRNSEQDAAYPAQPPGFIGHRRAFSSAERLTWRTLRCLPSGALSRQANALYLS